VGDNCKALLKMIVALFALSAAFALGPCSAALAIEAKPSATAQPERVKSFTVVSVLIGQTKFWLPSTIIVDQGDRVKLTLRNEAPGQDLQHGFSIPGYKISELVVRGQPKTITFTANRPGVFAYYCQIHPAHVGGQLMVRPKKAAPRPVRP
jgi:nitrosocyanin